MSIRPAASPTTRTTEIFLRSQMDQGRSWTQVTRLSTEWGSAYTGVREVAPGELFVVYSIGRDTVGRSVFVKRA